MYEPPTLIVVEITWFNKSIIYNSFEEVVVIYAKLDVSTSIFEPTVLAK